MCVLGPGGQNGTAYDPLSRGAEKRLAEQRTKQTAASGLIWESHARPSSTFTYSQGVKSSSSRAALNSARSAISSAHSTGRRGARRPRSPPPVVRRE